MYSWMLQLYPAGSKMLKTLSQIEAQERDGQITQLSDCKVLTEEEVVQLASKCKELLQQETNVTHVHAPVVVVGDTHGQVRGEQA